MIVVLLCTLSIICCATLYIELVAEVHQQDNFTIFLGHVLLHSVEDSHLISILV